MSDLIEVLRMRNPETDPDCHEAADEIERLDDVRLVLIDRIGAYQQENAKLRAAVDLAEAYRLADFKDQEEIGQELDRALAALEDDDELPD